MGGAYKREDANPIKQPGSPEGADIMVEALGGEPLHQNETKDYEEIASLFPSSVLVSSVAVSIE